MALYNMEWVTNELIRFEIPKAHPIGHQRPKKIEHASLSVVSCNTLDGDNFFK